jgi:hypothetical protein
MLMELLNDHRTGQDETQLCSFVLGGRTEYGTYKQGLRELYKRIRGLRQAQTDYDLLLIDIEEQKELINNAEVDRDRRRAEIKLRQLNGQLEEATRGLADLKREAAIFYRECSGLKEKIGELTEEKRHDLDRKEWKWYHIKRAAIEKITTGRVGDVVLKNLCSLPPEERKEWADIIKNDKLLIEAFENSDYGRISMKAPTQEEIKLIEQEINESNDKLIT